MTTVFQKIIRGDIPCHRVFEDEHVLAFLDVAPLSKGHVLLIPKEEASSLHELSQESGAAMGSALVKIAKALVKVTGATDYNILQNNGVSANQAVFHVHFHIIPKYTKDDGLEIVWRSTELQDGGALAADLITAM